MGDLGRAVHGVGDHQAVPVDRGGFRQVVGDVEADPIALGQGDPGAGHLAVEGVGHDPLRGQDVPLDDRGLQVVDLHARLEAGGERLIAARVDRCPVGDGAGVDRGHVAHRLAGRVAGHDHARWHHQPANIVCSKAEVDARC